MKKSLLFTLFSLLFFTLGFLTHALFFPDLLANGITFIPKTALPSNTSASEQTSDLKPLITQITYDGKSFSRHNVTIEISRYIAITNISKDKPMSLESNNPLLSTPRGYGESEQIRVRLDEKGQFVVADKNNPEERLIITVK